MNLAELLSEVARSRPDKMAVRTGDGGAALTFAGLHGEADRVAAALQAAGLSPGDRVAVGMPNVPHFIFAYLGILRAGGVAVPLNVLLSEEEVARILEDADVFAVLSAGPFGDVVEEASARLSRRPRLERVETWDRFVAGGGRSSPVARDPDDLALLAYTSGTTGAPRGAMLTHGNLLANLQQQMAVPQHTVTEDDVLFLALPLFHIYGLNVTLGLLLMNAASGVLVERFEPVAALRAIEEHRVTILFGAPTMFGAWVSVPGTDQYDLSGVRLAVSGAAPLPSDVLRDFRDLFGVTIYEGYGLTETSPALTSARMSDEVRPGYVGRPLPGVELRLVDEEGHEVETGDPGEVVVRGPNVFKGYWNRPEETEAAFIEGWFRTGDIAIQDERGDIALVDRKRDLIIVSGFNVYPSEVEQALRSLPEVREAAVIGVPHAYTGEGVKAFVVVEAGAEVTADGLRQELRGKLARFKLPETIEIVQDLPQHPSGKVLRRALRT